MTQTTNPKKLFTFEEFLAYDDGTDTRYELVDGELVEMPPESQENNNIARFLWVELLKHFPYYLIAHKDVEIEVTGRRSKCRVPDLMVHSQESYTALTGASRDTITHDMPPPALVIEIVSPGTENRNRDYRYKRTEYAARGISEYWIVDPEMKQITVCKWIEGQYEDTIFTGTNKLQSDIVPAWELTVDQVFASVKNA